MLKRRIWVALLLVLALVPVNAVVVSAASDAWDWEADTSPITLKAYVHNLTAVTRWDNDVNQTARTFTEKTGVTLEIVKPATAEERTNAIALMFASDDLPDLMFQMPVDNPVVRSAIESGKLWAIDELVDQYAPKMRELPYFDQGSLTWLTEADGHCYQLCSGVYDDDATDYLSKYNGLVNTDSPCLLIRTDIYDAIGRPDMTTPDNVYEALKKVKQEYPDYLTLYVRNDYWGTTLFGPWLQQFGLDTWSGGEYYVHDGRLDHPFFAPEAREAVKFLSKIAREGILSKEAFTDDSTGFVSRVNNGECASFVWNLSMHMSKPSDESTTHEALPFLNSWKSNITRSGYDVILIPKSCKAPDRVIRFLEYAASEEGQQLQWWGIQGEKGQAYEGLVKGPHYYIDETGKATHFPEFVVERNSTWPQAQELTGTFAYRFYWSYKIKLQGFWPDASNEFLTNLNNTYKDRVVYQPYYPTRSFDMSDELKAIRTHLTEIESNYSAKILWAASEEEALSLYDQMLAEFTAAGVEKVYDYYTQKYQDNLAAAGA